MYCLLARPLSLGVQRRLWPSVGVLCVLERSSDRPRVGPFSWGFWLIAGGRGICTYMSDKDALPRVAHGRRPSRTEAEPEKRHARVPPRGRHAVGLGRVALRRVAVVRGSAPQAARPKRRFDRRREQMPLPDGFVDRRAA